MNFNTHSVCCTSKWKSLEYKVGGHVSARPSTHCCAPSAGYSSSFSPNILFSLSLFHSLFLSHLQALSTEARSGRSIQDELHWKCGVSEKACACLCMCGCGCVENYSPFRLCARIAAFALLNNCCTSDIQFFAVVEPSHGTNDVLKHSAMNRFVSPCGGCVSVRVRVCMCAYVCVVDTNPITLTQYPHICTRKHIHTTLYTHAHSYDMSHV